MVTSALHPVAPPAVRDAALLLARLGIGIAFAAHGWQKVDNGLAATRDGMATNGVPLPAVAAAFATAVEFAGGIALALGAATALAGVLLAVVMTGAFAFVHVPNGVFVRDGGWELVAALGAGALLLALSGPGRLSVDHLVGRVRTGRRREIVLDGPGEVADGDGRVDGRGAGDVDLRAEQARARD